MDLQKRLILVLVILLLLLNLVNVFLFMSITGFAVGNIQFEITRPNPINMSCGNLTTDHGRWNFVSCPVDLTNTTLEGALWSINGNYDQIYHYDSSTGNYDFYFYDFGFGSLDSFYPTECYVIRSKVDNIPFVLEGIPYVMNLEKNITTNYNRRNYVGWVYEITPRDEALASIGDNYDWLFHYNHSSGHWDWYYKPWDIGNIDEFRPCECYLVKATNNDLLNYTAPWDPPYPIDLW